MQFQAVKRKGRIAELVVTSNPEAIQIKSF